MMKIFWLGILILLFVGLSIAFASSTSTIQAETVEEPGLSPCEGVTIGEAKANITVDGSEVIMDGLYCANTGGYTIVEESIEENGDSVEASIVIDGPEEDQMVTQVITPVNFSMVDELTEGSYDLNYEVVVDEEVIESGSEDIHIGEQVESSSIFNRFNSWFSNLF